MKFYASVRLDIRRKEILPDNSGIRVKVRVVKNKVAAPFKAVFLDILFGQGIDGIGCTLDAAEELGVVDRKGSWYSFQEENIAQGRLNVIELMKNDPEFATEIESKVKEALANVGKEETESDEASEEKESEKAVAKAKESASEATFE